MLGQDPETGLDVTVKSGRFGPYIQLGEAEGLRRGRKAEARGHPEGLSARRHRRWNCALKLLSLPREVGKHPESGEPIKAGIGRFGPYVQHDKTYANLEAGDDVFTIGLNRAVTLIAEKIAKGPSKRPLRRRPGQAARRAPRTAAPIVVKNGRYGALRQPRAASTLQPAGRQDAGHHHAGARRRSR